MIIVTTLSSCRSLQFYEDCIKVGLPVKQWHVAYLPFKVCNLHSAPVDVVASKRLLKVYY